MSLSNEEIGNFINEGYVIIRNAFPRKIADECRGLIWQTLEKENSIERLNPLTWSANRRIGLSKTFSQEDGEPWSKIFTDKILDSISLLIGDQESFGKLDTGWWIVSFPGHDVLPPGLSGKMHVDGHWFRHYPFSKEIGLIVLFLFSDIKLNGGGTCMARKSHIDMIKHLSSAGKYGMISSELKEVINANLDGWELDEFYGSAGDVCLMHPLLVHGRGKNLSTIDEENVRFLSHSIVSLKNDLDLNKAINLMTPLEYSISMVMDPSVRKELVPALCEDLRNYDYLKHNVSPEDFTSGIDDLGLEAEEMVSYLGFSSFSSGSSRKRNKNSY